MNNYSYSEEISTDFPLLGFDRDLKLLKDFLQYIHLYGGGQQEESGIRIMYGIEGQSNRIEGVDTGEKASKRKMKALVDDAFLKPGASGGKTSFLVFKNQKYTTVPTQDIAFFYIRNDSASIMCFDKQEFTLNKSLDHITNSVSPNQFFRVNRKYLINFKAIKEVEQYFMRKLYVKLSIETPDKLLINKEKNQSFLSWMEDR